MTTKKRILIILIIIFGTPFITTMLGMLIQRVLAPQDTSGLVAGFSLVIGMLASVLSLLTGPLVSYSMKNSDRQYISLIGYVAPGLLGILYVLYLAGLFEL